MFAVSTFLWAATVAQSVIWTRMILLSDSPTPLDQRIDQANQSVNTLLYLKAFGFNVNFFIGDALMTWRVTALYSWSRWVKVVLISLWLTSLATLGLGYTLCVSLSHFQVQPPNLCLYLDTGCWVLSLVLNAIATILMVRIAWSKRKARKAIYRDSESEDTTTRVDRILYILSISGVIYCVIGLFGLTGFALTSPSNQIYVGVNVLISIGDQLVGLYPTAVLVFILNEESIFGPGLSSPTLVAGEITQSIGFTRTREATAIGNLDSSRGENTRTFSKSNGSGPLHFSVSGALDSSWVRNFELDSATGTTIV
ncbi:hypothetical protein AURDEDRAFT_153776 [Auricularia subglabra TFB-10046 SS5]|uniref:G-protein coupled receptors family 1 profile domain-containing protein n=1 Tax=Auricularia subglabra (strain TFB-10046 / SS5) TaxID=717982 RepID=J0WXC5_AURST|nr:hypothetical protein AURDEDRAFT_153776 [Auricularia subglabra TFB-10046 SS5]